MDAFQEGADEMENIACQEQANSMLKGAYDVIRSLDDELYDDLPDLDSVPLEKAAEFVEKFKSKIVITDLKDRYVLKPDADIDELADEIYDFFNPKDEQDDETE